jgi:lipocalin
LTARVNYHETLGHKIVKARNRGTGDQYEHNYYNGMQEGNCIINVDDLNNFNDEYKNFKNKMGDVKGKHYLQGNNNSNSRRVNFELPDERNNRNDEYNVLNKKKKY